MEVLRNVAPFLQPSPLRNPGGDCFACALTAAMRYLFPEKHPSFDECWESFLVESIGGSKVLSNTWIGMERACWKMRDRNYPVEVHHDITIPVFDPARCSYSFWNTVPLMDWSYRLEAWLAAGWIALTEISMEPQTTIGGHATDHFVVLDGQRHYWRKHETLPSASLDHETHVVCSRKGGYWINTEKLMRNHGAELPH